ncbi:hypothetical protein LTS14_004895 [Recurvomyces mirabilis]|uniref:uncharacterized protein n=1 Tax=Recurvomyces mirabilis TaxID=574656 RepID=UPI002DE008B6|nr:hypothetical protein LTS14_004895 [Recurvomyces mirabilis]
MTKAFSMSLPDSRPSFDDQTSFDNANRGFIAALEPCIIKNKDGKDVWNDEDYAFLSESCPSSANPSLWRQGQLTSKQGLFEVTAGIYQIRGFDISNMTLAEGKTGVVVLDCLQSVECAAKALEFYRLHRGERPVMGLVYSHCHYDHFSGALGILPNYSSDAESVPIIAPAGFLEEVLKEKVVVGPAMLNRAVYMFGESLPKGPTGHIGCGLGIASSSGTRSLIPPNDIITTTGQSRTIDDVQLVFQMVPDTEAPSEFNVFFPAHRALCIAECATNTMHNIATLRGAAVRDAKKWSKHLDETIDLYGKESDVLFSSHHWPTWGRKQLIKFISDQRDLYGYMHDQTVRMMNTGLTGVEIAETLRLPPALQREWHTREYYGALNQNIKGIYQRYMTWFDGNAANLWKHVPVEEGKRYVACMGGVDAVMKKAQESARQQLAQVYETLAFGSENAVWRNYYLTTAHTLRSADDPGMMSRGAASGPLAISPYSSVEDWLDALSLRIDGPEASNLHNEIVVSLTMLDDQVTWILRLRHGTLTYRSRASNERRDGSFVDLEVTLSKADLYKVISTGTVNAIEGNQAGDLVVLKTLLSVCGF